MPSFLSTLFGGGAEREAADRNRALYGNYQTGANTALDAGLNRSVDALRTGYGGAMRALDDTGGLYGDLRTRGTNILNTGLANSSGALDAARGAYDPLAALGAEYGRGREMYQNSLGLNGAAGNAAAVGAFQAGPGYEWALEQGNQALNRRRAAAGMLNSGNADIDAIKFGQGLANQEYGGWQDRLAGFMPLELQATSGAATGRANANTAIADLHTRDALSRLGLETGVTQGQAGVNAARAQNDVALGNSLSGLYTGDASNRVGVLGNVTSGNVSANNQQAAGEASGARNLWNAGMQVASLAAGGLGGMGGGSFGSMFGGGGSVFGNGTGFATNPWSNNGMFAAGPAGASRGFV